MIKNWEYRRGDIYLANLSPFCGSEQGGVRPVVVIQNNTGNKHAPTLVVATITAKTRKKTKQPTHYLIRNNPALSRPSLVLLEQLRTIDKQRIIKYLGRVTRKEMRGVDAASASQSGFDYILLSVKTMGRPVPMGLPILLPTRCSLNSSGKIWQE